MNIIASRTQLRRHIGLVWNLRNMSTKEYMYRPSRQGCRVNQACLENKGLDLAHNIRNLRFDCWNGIRSLKLKTENQVLRRFASSVKEFLPSGVTLGFGFFSSNSHPQNFISEIAKITSPAVAFVEIKGEHPKSKKRVTLANGSGFIVSSNGLLLTNAHVVENKSHVTIKLHDGSVFDGLVVVVDPVSDLAVIKIQTNRSLPVIPLGKSADIRPGEFVAAMGSPLSLHKTITYGIISSPLRDSNELGMRNNMDYIQTDAVIGLGNSGGPLVNMDGEAIGINTLKLTEGISFAIPSDYAAKIIKKAQDLVAKGDPIDNDVKRRRYLGITMLPLSPQIILQLKEKQPEFPDVIKHGVYVYAVKVSSPAYVGGLHAGDVIVAINGGKMTTSADVYSMVETKDHLTVKVLRGKHFETLKIQTESYLEKGDQ